MKVSIQLAPSSLTPSGKGLESFKVRRPGNRLPSIVFYDLDSGEVVIHAGARTLQQLSEQLREGTA